MKMRPFRALLALGFLAGASSAQAQAIDLDQWAGAYRVRHKIYDVPQQKMLDAENILEIVKHSPKTAYFRFRLLFTNGHSCSGFGIAEADGSGLTYRAEQSAATGQSCVIRIEPRNGTLSLASPDGADGMCRRYYCGANGTIEGAAFPQAQKRQITYTDRIVQSRQYKEAIEEYERLLRGQDAKSTPAKQP
jgi:hypothetical protein